MWRIGFQRVNESSQRVLTTGAAEQWLLNRLHVFILFARLRVIRKMGLQETESLSKLEPSTECRPIFCSSGGITGKAEITKGNRGSIECAGRKRDRLRPG